MKKRIVKKILTAAAGLLLAIAVLTFGMAAASAAGTPVYSSSDLFTDRDLEQTADLSKAVTYTVSDDEDITITAAGVYVLTGTAKNATVTVEADKEDKVQLVLLP